MRLGEYMEEKCDEYLAILKDEGTPRQIFTLNQIVMGFFEYDIPTKILCGLVNTAKLVDLLRQLYILEKLTNLIKMIL